MKNRKTALAVAATLVIGFGAAVPTIDTQAATPQEAISKIAPYVVKYDDAGGMLPSVKIAQILLESGNLSSELATKANNPVGMKFSAPFSNLYPDAYYVLHSGEYGSSGYYTQESKFRKYDSIEEAIKDHAELFTSTEYRKNLYSPALNAKNYKDQANALTGTYAKNPIYGQRLIEIIEKYDLTKYDKGNAGGNTTVTAPVADSGEFVLSASTPVYVTASDAKNGKNSYKSYPAGKYFVYKTADGAVNITLKKGNPGAWVSTGSVKTPAPSTPVQTAPVTNGQKDTNNGKYVLSAKTSTYRNASDAAAGKNAVGSYMAGTYYIYKEVQGSINISRTPGVAGSWISLSGKSAVTTPVAESTKPVTSAPVIKNPSKTVPSTEAKPVVSGDYTLTGYTKVYANAADAKSGKNSINTYAPGTYFIYKEYNGAVNISRKAGVPGAWISYSNETYTKKSAPAYEYESTVPATTPEIKEETVSASPVVEEGTYVLDSAVPVYSSAADAVKGTNAVKTYEAGTYYIFKYADGAVNISRSKGTPGAWIAQ